MKLKETTLDQRLFAGLVCLIIFVLGMLSVGEVAGKILSFCSYVSFDIEILTLRVYVILATIGGGLGVLHLLSSLRFRK